MMANVGRRKKILILADWYEPGFLAGGPIQSVKNFVIAMNTHYDLFVVTGDRDLGDQIPYPGINTEQWEVRPPGVPVFYTRKLSGSLLRRLITEINPEFLYLNSLYSYRFSIIPLLLLRQGKIKARLVLSPRGMLRASAVAHKSTKKKPFLAAFRALGLPQRITFHATDEQEKTDIRRHFSKAREILTIPNFSPVVQVRPARLEKSSGFLRCVFVGRIMDIKNLAFFTSLLPKLQPQVIVELSIYGAIENETYWSEIQTRIDAFPPNIRVVYHGPVPHAEVRAVLDRHHLFVLPTRGENFGHAIFEAFAAGRPVLISDKTPWRELVGQSAGWDLSIEDSDAWVQALTSAASWNQSEFEKYVAGALSVAMEYQVKTDLTVAYQQLFS